MIVSYGQALMRITCYDMFCSVQQTAIWCQVVIRVVALDPTFHGFRFWSRSLIQKNWNVHEVQFILSHYRWPVCPHIRCIALNIRKIPMCKVKLCILRRNCPVLENFFTSTADNEKVRSWWSSFGRSTKCVKDVKRWIYWTCSIRHNNMTSGRITFSAWSMSSYFFSSHSLFFTLAKVLYAMVYKQNYAYRRCTFWQKSIANFVHSAGQAQKPDNTNKKDQIVFIFADKGSPTGTTVFDLMEARKVSLNTLQSVPYSLMTSWSPTSAVTLCYPVTRLSLLQVIVLSRI